MWKSWPFVPWNSCSVSFSCSWSWPKFKPLFISLDFYMNALQNLHFLVFCIQISVFFLKLNLIISLPCLTSIKDFSMLYRVQDKYYTHTHTHTHTQILCDLNHICHFSCISQDSHMCPHAQVLFYYVWQSKAWGCISTFLFTGEFSFLKYSVYDFHLDLIKL